MAALLRDQHAHVRPVEEQLGERAAFTYDETWDPEALVAARPDIVVCVNDWPYEIARCLDAARAAGIPSLVLQDGILEWRCQYENPLFGAGGGAPQHQPVLADRIACIGEQSARQIAAWGNAGRVEVTGMPRLDHLLRRAPRPPARPGRVVLVMTAKNAGFTGAQREVTLRSLRDVREHLATRPGIEVLWRVSGEMAWRLGVENLMRETSSVELADVVERADAVITTPSTAMLEAMRLGRPVAALDYHNVPRFVATAWTISAPEQIAPVVASLLAPDAPRMAFQEDTLADALMGGPAAPRVAALIERMARERSAAGAPADVHAGGTEGGDDGETLVAARAPRALGDLYPGVSAFAERDPVALQARLARLEKENELLRRELREGSMAQRLRRLGRALGPLGRGRR
ncbi:MAG TPA: hypothetical protein VF041_07025 [Gemmatimonadaceae bacterium]